MNPLNIKKLKNTKFRNPLLIEGLPGMGNVGKIAIDFIIESLKAEKVYEINSYDFPNCVFVNEKGVVELPKIEIYHKKMKSNDLFLVSGDAQPIGERGCYELCDKVLDIFQDNGGKSLITLGGIGLEEMPKKPEVYCTGTEKKAINKLKISGVKTAEGIVGPVLGVSGVLLGLAKKRGMEGTILLVETYGNPAYLGIKESRELLKVLNTNLKLGINISKLDKEVKLIEKEIKEKLEAITAVQEEKKKGKDEITYYIG